MLLIDEETVERMYRAGKETGSFLQFAIFDKRVLLPLDYALQGELTQAGLTEPDLADLASVGWFEFLKRPTDLGGGMGVPLYVPSRVKLFLELRSKGYTDHELRSYSQWEEYWIDNFITVDDLAYEDDDLKLLMNDGKERIAFIESNLRGDAKAEAQLHHLERAVRWLETRDPKALTPAQRERIERAAFGTRMTNEGLRLFLVEKDRDVMRAGYSPFLSFRSTRWKSKGVEVEGPMWTGTLRSPWAEEAGFIRLPGFLLREDRIEHSAMIPSEYERVWKRYDIEGYIKALAEIRGETRCGHCLSNLAEDRKRTQIYCSDTCRSRAKQKRLREKNPDSIFETQRKYYRSLGDDED